ncbi:GNAT family N-acetyltransferase [Paracoccus caeni]|uniref:L-ornithine N(alpha)-acyltransferase n=1 Tax=Paracoccus caeni TaxID=657651 RepID=A0A934W242_9RHOB|nr:GNAT family N-acyltransferase [Paracoccus caeni]MBK4217409.1 GNAT family N-acetyltransferase [Paracoccus caeni]
MQPFRRGRYQVRLAATPEDVRAAQRLRWLCFIARNGDVDDGTNVDADDMDTDCQHMMVEIAETGQVLCCFRFQHFANGSEISHSYSAQFYNLAALQGFDAPMLEMGRFCVHPEFRDPDIIRSAWMAVSRYVQENGIEMLFGCSSFIGTEPEQHADAFAMLRARHLGPRRWLPRVKAPNVFRFARKLRLMTPDQKRAMAAMPPLLRSYLAMGGWVSDHAVVDPAMRTMHVFTGVEIRAIPPGRKRLLQSSGD